jgi:hypothetical protein
MFRVRNVSETSQDRALSHNATRPLEESELQIDKTPARDPKDWESSADESTSSDSSECEEAELEFDETCNDKKPSGIESITSEESAEKIEIDSCTPQHGTEGIHVTTSLIANPTSVLSAGLAIRLVVT